MKILGLCVFVNLKGFVGEHEAIAEGPVMDAKTSASGSFLLLASWSRIILV